MIILKVQAGLGNQMFQYAYGRALALRSSKAFNENIPLSLDLSWFSNQAARDTKRYYGLNHFNIQAEIIGPDEVKECRGILETKPFKLIEKISRRIKRDIFGWSDYVYYPSAAKPVRNKCVEGYWWNSESYFKDYADIIRKDFTLKEPLGLGAQTLKTSLEQKINAGMILVVIQVRRGDYLTNTHANSFHGAKGVDYFDKAVAELCSRISSGKNPSSTDKLHFCIVSDDIEWAKENIKPKSPAGEYLSAEFFPPAETMADYEQMYLMSLCHHFIISNSTFSWWGAWLSTTAQNHSLEKIVIGPKQWVANTKINTKDVMPESWIRI